MTYNLGIKGRLLVARRGAMVRTYSDMYNNMWSLHRVIQINHL